MTNPTNTFIHPKITTDSKIAGYLRKSRDDIEAKDGDTLSKHRKQLGEYIERHGLTNVEMFEEVGSGESIDERPVFSELLERIREGEFAAVLVVHNDRVSRGSQLEAGFIQEAFHTTGTLLITLEKVYDYSNESDMVLSEFQSVIARQELRNIKRRLLGGKKQTVKNGNSHNGIVPYGYKWDKNTKSVIVNEDEREHYRNMVDMYINKRMSAGEIADKFNEMLIPTPRGGLWRSERITTILKNDFHLGYVVFRRFRSYKTGTKNKHGRTRYRTKVNPNQEEMIKSRGNHEPLKTEEEHARILERAEQLIAKPKRQEAAKPNRLAGLIYCPHCGKCQTVSKPPNRSPHVRKCLRKSRTRTPECDATVGLLEDVLFEMVIEHMTQFKDRLFEPKEIDEQEQPSTLGNALQRYEAAIEAEEKRIAKTKEMFYADIVTIDELKATTEAANQKIKELSEKATEIRSNIAMLESSKAEQRKNVWNSSGVIELLKDSEKLSSTEINKILRSVIERIEYTIDGDNVEISVTYY